MRRRKFRIRKRLVGALTLLVAVAFGTVFGLTGCGDMSETDVVNTLSSNLNDASTFVSTGTMEVESEGQMHTYFVEVVYSKDDLYRVTMRNEVTGNEQVILKNADGVFVLTPALNKQFKFQSEWPMTSSQVYLYQSLVEDILNAETTVFEVLEDAYAFTVGADYQRNGEFTEQVINFDRKTLTPTLVQVRDAEGVVRMSMVFDSFEWNVELCDDYFKAEAIMEAAQDVMGDAVVSVTNVEEALLYPTYHPEGTYFVDKTTIATTHGERVIMSFTGDHDFTIIQETARVRDVMQAEHMRGEPVLVNGTVAAFDGNTLTWQRNGVEFFMVSETLERDQFISVASSIGSVYEK